MNAYENAIEIKGVNKRYDGFTLDNITFDVPKGCITNIDSGEISLLGLDHVKDETELKKRIAVVFDELPFHDMFSVKDMAKIFRGLYPKWDDEAYMKYIDRFQLPSKKKIGQFSKGMKMKLQIACALSHNAELLVMDEATTGLDPVVRDEILHIFMEYLENGERSILMSSHITSDLEKIADMVTFIDKGRILLTGYKDEILEKHGILKCDKDKIKEIDADDIVSIRTNNFGAEVMVNDRENAGYKYRDCVIDPASLDDIMLYYVHRDAKEWS